MKEVKREADRRHIEMVIVPTREAIRLMRKGVSRKCHSPRDRLEELMCLADTGLHRDNTIAFAQSAIQNLFGIGNSEVYAKSLMRVSS